MQTPINEPILNYEAKSVERKKLEEAIKALAASCTDIPVVVGGEELKPGNSIDICCPHNHKHKLGQYYKAGPGEINKAIAAAKKAWPAWSAMSQEARSAIFLRAADLLAGPWRYRFNAATMLELSKTCFQAEIDAVCELADFWRFNVHYLDEIAAAQPYSPPGMKNALHSRPLEGFVAAVTPFNFVSISANLSCAPALLGNTIIWKPSRNAILTGYLIMQLMKEAGLPNGVINFLPSDGQGFMDTALADADFAGVHFTGSTKVFQKIWGQIGQAVSEAKLNSYPRIVGETGGKDFVFAHESANVDALVTGLIRGAFEYQGQKCSAASRAYIPDSIWPELKDKLVSRIKEIKIGDPADFSNFMCAVIDKRAYERISKVINDAKTKKGVSLVVGGDCDDSTGYFISPTIFEVDDPRNELMLNEYFAPLLAIHVYKPKDLDDMLAVCNDNPYALTGAIFAQDQEAINHMSEVLKYAAGNFYINDKPTGAVVGQQPFGGGRASGTNDKAGSVLNLHRWISPRTIKETWAPPLDWKYPHMS